MKIEEVTSLFKKHYTEYLKFDRVKSPKSRRPDLCAFLILDEICPGDRDIVSSAEHDEIWLGVSVHDVKDRITEDQIIDLIRCGVRLDDTGEGFSMFA